MKNQVNPVGDRVEVPESLLLEAKRLIGHAGTAEYNAFEPDNQSEFWHELKQCWAKLHTYAKEHRK